MQAKAEPNKGNTLLITWSTEIAQDARPSDVLMYLLYFPHKRAADYGIGEYFRKDGSMLLQIDRQYQGLSIEIMIGFKSVTDDRVSTSQYLGAILL